jgi:hypothetical protein
VFLYYMKKSHINLWQLGFPSKFEEFSAFRRPYNYSIWHLHILTNGAVVLFQKRMKRNIMYLACRHHFLELVIVSIFVLLFGESTGPSPELFENFRRNWSMVKQNSFQVIFIWSNGQVVKNAYVGPSTEINCVWNFNGL